MTPPQPSAIVEVEGLTYDYPGTRALDDVSFALPSGSITALVGPNGAGKTTLLRCLAALDEPLRGSVRLLGRDALADPPATHRQLGYLPDSFGLYDRLSVERCLLHRALAQGVPAGEAADRVLQAASRVGLADRLGAPAGSLSRGLRQRLAIAQAIIHAPPLLILDEPASGLDPEARLALSSLLLTLRAEGMTLLVSSHILAELEDYSTHLMILEGGRLLSFEALHAALPDRRRRFLVILAERPPDLVERLPAGVVAEEGGRLVATLPDDLLAQAALLRSLVEAGLPVARFEAERGSLQDAYLERVRGIAAMSRGVEFRRNLWLEFSPQRLVAMPLIITVVVLLSQFSGGSDPELLSNVGIGVFYALVFLWGSRRAAGSVADEVNGGTWTGQRLSALSPGALALGKLFGATAFVWYGGLIGLGLAAFGELAEGRGADQVLLLFLQRLASGVLLLALALLASLALLNKRRVADRLGTTFPQFLALAAALLLLALGTRVSLFQRLELWGETVDWYGMAVPGDLFATLSATCFMAWALLGAVRLMATQLQRALLPWAWPLFLLFCMGYGAGLIGQAEDAAERPLLGFAVPLAVALTGTYIALFAERNEALRFRRLAAAWRAGERRRALTLLPWWVPSWILLLVASLLASDSQVVQSNLVQDLAAELGFGRLQPLAGTLSFATFALRDIAFVLLVNAGSRSERADLTAFVYLLVLYVPLQSLLAAAGGVEASRLLVPLPVSDDWLPVASGLLQAALLFWLARRRWRRLFAAALA